MSAHYGHKIMKPVTFSVDFDAPYRDHGQWERTPWWVFWRPAWRRLIWPWDYIDDPYWQYASPVDFLLMK